MSDEQAAGAPNGNEFRSTVALAGVDPVCLLGPADANLRCLAQHFRSRVVVREGEVRLQGPASEQAELEKLLGRLVARCRKGEAVSPELVEAECRQLARKAGPSAPDPGEVITLKTPRRSIVAKSANQEQYLRAIGRSEIVLAIGPAGTGKTYLAVAAAVAALSSGRANRIVLTRPAVEAGESLGYLPGSFKDKVDPYLRPLYDALFDMMPVPKVKRLSEEEVIEVAPLAYMRGRTLSDSYIILDEAQNTTSTQMRMFLTRLGWNSRAIVTGDVTQIDLANPSASGLVEAEQRLAGVKGISICRFDRQDVVRPPLVSRIIAAYGSSRPAGGHESADED
jgi:phosphate starvation-inducible PhoH-like protein